MARASVFGGRGCAPRAPPQTGTHTTHPHKNNTHPSHAHNQSIGGKYSQEGRHGGHPSGGGGGERSGGIETAAEDLAAKHHPHEHHHLNPQEKDAIAQGMRWGALFFFVVCWCARAHTLNTHTHTPHTRARTEMFGVKYDELDTNQKKVCACVCVCV